MQKIIKNQKGQGLVEYLIIVSIMAIGTMAVMRVMNQTVKAKFELITQTLQGGKPSISIRTDSLQESDFKKRDMSDFFHGASSAEEK